MCATGHEIPDLAGGDGEDGEARPPPCFGFGEHLRDALDLGTVGVGPEVDAPAGGPARAGAQHFGGDRGPFYSMKEHGRI